MTDTVIGREEETNTIPQMITVLVSVLLMILALLDRKSVV